MRRTMRKTTAVVLALLLCMMMTFAAFAEDEGLDYELLDVSFICRTDFYQYISNKDLVFDLKSMAKELGYVSAEKKATVESEASLFTDREETVQVGFAEGVTDNGYKIFRDICYGKNDKLTVCTFEREDRYDGSDLYCVNTADSYTVSMDQILLLTYIMENLSDENPDPLAELYGEYFIDGVYKFPV